MSQPYVLGRSGSESDRLRLQGQAYAPDTTYLLERAGIVPGMHALDVGCGVGDVTLALAEIVGPTGSVTAVDSDPGVLEIARRRAAAAELTTITFRQATLPDLALAEPVDAIAGRLILVHLPEPVSALRALTRLVRPGGVVTFQEIATSTGGSSPWTPLVASTYGHISATVAAGGADPDAGRSLFQHFVDAGLPAPRLASCQPASGDQDPAPFDLLAATLDNLLPMAETHGITTADEVRPGTLGDRLRAEATANRAVLFLPQLVAAWSRTHRG